MLVHYHRTVWKNSYAEHEVTGKTYNQKKKYVYVFKMYMVSPFLLTFLTNPIHDHAL